MQANLATDTFADTQVSSSSRHERKGIDHLVPLFACCMQSTLCEGEPIRWPRTRGWRAQWVRQRMGGEREAKPKMCSAPSLLLRTVAKLSKSHNQLILSTVVRYDCLKHAVRNGAISARC
eukprot:2720845-Amphidinium_carterae.1